MDEPIIATRQAGSDVTTSKRKNGFDEGKTFEDCNVDISRTREAKSKTRTIILNPKKLITLLSNQEIKVMKATAKIIPGIA